MNIRPESACDGYKLGHHRQYPKNTQIVASNLTGRSTRREYGDKSVVPFGIQYFVKEYLIHQWNENFFSQPIEKIEKRFTRRVNKYLGPNNIGFDHLRALHKLGYLPISIWALPEGSVVPIGVPLFIIFNTDENFGWITNYLETLLSTTIWGPCTSATTAHAYKKLFMKFAMETVGNTDFVPYQGHDFSMRGMFGMEAALMSSGGHMLSFFGTDTIPAIDWLEDYYNADCEKETIGCSVAATEHSVACVTILNFVKKTRGVEGQMTHDEKMNLADIEYVRHLITEVYPTGIVSIVSDSFDYWNTITNTARVLKDVILARDGKVVFRPDTGDPVKVVCGYKVANLDDDYDDTDLEIAQRAGAEAVRIRGEHWFLDTKKIKPEVKHFLSEAEIKGSIECLWEIFGGTITAKGYKQLNSHVGLIYGDSITYQRATAICEGLKAKIFASTNLVYGIGSYTYQFVTRDTDGYAVKATWCKVDGEEIEIFKDPKTDELKVKKSAFGLVAVFKNEAGQYYLKDHATWSEVKNCEFLEIFTDGKLIKDWTLAEVRANLAKYE
jgi:nicotinamide phosphoribosyltransferase